MTYSHYDKVFKQLRKKPAILKKYKKHNASRERIFGVGSRRCQLCGRMGSLVRKYKINLCRHCFRENAYQLGFKKFH